jgi:hypothetical protein
MYARVERETHEGRWEAEAKELAQRYANETGQPHGVHFSMGNRAAGMTPHFSVMHVMGSPERYEWNYNRGVYYPQGA